MISSRTARLLGLAALVLGVTLIDPSSATAQSSRSTGVDFPPRNVDVRTAETQQRLQRRQQVLRQAQDQRLNRLTAGKAAPNGATTSVVSGDAVAATRIAVQAVIGAVLAASAMSAFGEDASLLVEAGSGASDGDSTSTDGADTTSSTTTTSTTTN